MIHFYTTRQIKIPFASFCSTSYVCTKIAKIRSSSPLLCHRTHLAWPLFMHTYFLYIHSLSLLIDFYSDSSFCYSQFLGYFSFYLSLTLHFTKPISKRFLCFSFYSLRPAYTFQYTIINSIVIASFVQKKEKFQDFVFQKKFLFAYVCNLETPPLCTQLYTFGLTPPFFLRDIHRCTLWMIPKEMDDGGYCQ